MNNFLTQDFGLDSSSIGGYQAKFEALKKKSNDQEIKIVKKERFFYKFIICLV